jgi:hypothetical protein
MFPRKSDAARHTPEGRGVEAADRAGGEHEHVRRLAPVHLTVPRVTVIPKHRHPSSVIG